MRGFDLFFVNSVDTALSERLAPNRTEAIDTWWQPSGEACQVRSGQILDKTKDFFISLQHHIALPIH